MVILRILVSSTVHGVVSPEVPGLGLAAADLPRLAG
jgi:hypothetical protein